MHTILEADPMVSSKAAINPSQAPTSLAELPSGYPAASHTFYLNLAQSV
jgi:hypothetical protein